MRQRIITRVYLYFPFLNDFEANEPFSEHHIFTNEPNGIGLPKVPITVVGVDRGVEVRIEVEVKVGIGEITCIGIRLKMGTAVRVFARAV